MSILCCPLNAHWITEWEAIVFDDEQINAFAVPGGKIGVYTGILNVAQTPDQLAAIVAMSGHVIAQHAAITSIQRGSGTINWLSDSYANQ